MKIQLSTGLILTLLTVVYQSKSCINDPGCTSCDVYLLGFVPIAFKCSKCDINYYLNSTNWVCYCTAGYYYEDASTECVKCNNPLCKQCTSSSVCTSCVESNNRILVNGECSCLQGYESVNNNQVCTKKQNILLIILSSVGSLVFCFLTIFVFYKICLARAIQEQQIHDMSANHMQKNSVSVYIQGDMGFMQSNSITPTSFWNAKQYQFKNDQICSICLDTKALFMTDCGHYFHSKCIYNWLSNKENCPNCNKQLNSKDLKRWCEKCMRVLMPVIVNISLKRSGKGKRQIIKSSPVEHQICDQCQSQSNQKQTRQLFQ